MERGLMSTPIRSVTLPIRHAVPASPSPISTWAPALRGLGVNTLRIMGGWGTYDMYGIRVDADADWDINFDNLLTTANNFGFKIMFWTLGHVNQDATRGELGINDCLAERTIASGRVDSIATAKSYIDALEYSPNLHHNFITDPRIAMWSVSNECLIGTVPSATTPTVTLNAQGSWTVELSQYIRGKGGKTSIPNPTVTILSTGVRSFDPKLVASAIAPYVDYLDWHPYLLYNLARSPYCTVSAQVVPSADENAGNCNGSWGTVTNYGTYNWTSWEQFVRSTLQSYIALTPTRVSDIFLSEFGMVHGYSHSSCDANTMAKNWAYSNQDCINYFTHYFNALNGLGIQHLGIHEGVSDGYRADTSKFRWSLNLDTGEKRADYSTVATRFSLSNVGLPLRDNFAVLDGKWSPIIGTWSAP